MKAIILVGGEGTRMRPLTFHTPKPLLPVANVPFIERQIRWLHAHGIDEVILSLAYLPDLFEEYFHENPPVGVHLDYAVESEPLGTAGAIKYAAQNPSESFVVCNGDVLTNLDLTQLINFHESRSSTATIALTYVDDPSAFGVVPTKQNGEVIAFVEKPPKDNAPSHWINAGIYVLTPEFLDLVPEGINVSIERETFPRVLETGAMYALESDEYWLDIGTPVQYLRAHRDYLSDQTRFGQSDHLHEVSPGLFSDGDITVGTNVKIVSPSLVGSGSVVGDNCVLDAATLGSRCVLEDNVHITGSVVISGSKINSSSIVIDSVIGEASDISNDVVLEDFTLVGAHEKIEPHAHLRAERFTSVV